MATKKLTDRSITVKAPASGRIELWDSLLPGFGLRVSAGDSRTYFVMYRANTAKGRVQRRLKIGDAKVIDLGPARDLARAALEKATRGIDPAQEKRPLLAAAGDTVQDVATDYLERYAKKNTRASSYKETKRIFDVDVLPAWGARPIKDIARHDVNVLLDRIAGRGAEVQANRTLARLKTFFTWAVDEEILTVSPVARMKPKTRETARDRALTDDEIKLFWQACDAIGWPFGHLFKLLLVTAQRRDEVGTIAHAEIDLEKRLWSIPRQKAKNDRAHEVSLSDLAVSVVKSVYEARPATKELKESPWLFTTNGETVVSGFSRAKERLDAEMEKLARKARGLPEKDEDLRKTLNLKPGAELPRFVPEFILHDLRRTAATGMARQNVPPHVVDRILNHVSGTIRGVAAVYNRHAYTEERKAALDGWGAHLAGLVAAASKTEPRA